MSKVEAPVGLAIKEVITKVVQIVLGKPVEQTSGTVITQNEPLSEDSRREIENMTNEIKY